MTKPVGSRPGNLELLRGVDAPRQHHQFSGRKGGVALLGLASRQVGGDDRDNPVLAIGDHKDAPGMGEVLQIAIHRGLARILRFQSKGQRLAKLVLLFQRDQARRQPILVGHSPCEPGLGLQASWRNHEQADQ